MKERPILFSGPMVRAILDGRKTMTRRVVKVPKWIERLGGDLSRAFADKAFGVTPCLQVPCSTDGNGVSDSSVQRLRNPWIWSEPSRLWVKHSAWYDKQVIEGIGCLRSFSTFDGYVSFADGRPAMRDVYSQMSNQWTPELLDKVNATNTSLKRRSARFLHRWASRITLEITSVRAERLHDITEDDAKTEGVEKDYYGNLTVIPERLLSHGAFPKECHRYGFGVAWEKINGKKYPWASNPWVWVIEFQKTDTNANTAPSDRSTESQDA